MSLTASRLEYAHAFDLMEWPSDWPVLAVVSTTEFVDLTLARTVGPVTLLCEGARTLAHARERLAQGYVPAGIVAEVLSLSAGDLSEPFRAHQAAIWAAPQPATWPSMLAIVERALCEGGTLSVLTVTRVGAALQGLRRSVLSGEPQTACGDLIQRLQRGEWHVERTLGMGGAAAVWWAVWGRLMGAAGQRNMADRAERAHHDAVPDVRAASFRLVRARHGRRAD